VKFLEFLPLFLKLLGNHGIILNNFRLEVLAIPECLLDLSLQACLVLDSFTTVCHELLGQFLDLISLLFELLDRLAFDFNHFLEVIALNHEIRDGFFVMSFVDSANLD
jgi:hypothetical protein